MHSAFKYSLHLLYKDLPLHYQSFLNKASLLLNGIKNNPPTWQKGKQHNFINYLKFISAPSAVTI